MNKMAVNAFPCNNFGSEKPISIKIMEMPAAIIISDNLIMKENQFLVKSNLF